MRILATSSRDLGQLTQEGRFRTDLFYLLGVVHVEVPPLRLREEDILPLARQYLSLASGRSSVVAKPLSPRVAERLLGHAWPGNLAELKNSMERAAILAGPRPRIEVEHLSASLRSIRGDFANVQHHQVLPMAKIERRYVLEVPRQSDSNCQGPGNWS
ncbi:MAG: hypothetical protein GY811_28120 [Myxococcales bacterium]|nr:hypothetical protein [Myxococcales bacterium]